MSLNFHLLTRITLVAVICLMATIFAVIYQADRQTQLSINKTADSIAKQLQVQLFRIDAGSDQPGHFPDLELWKQTRLAPGICIRYTATDAKVNNGICLGPESPLQAWPKLFEQLYRYLFIPDLQTSRTIHFKNTDYGSITVSASPEMSLARVWENVISLISLSALTIFAVSTLVYLTVYKALRPAGIIISSLRQMQDTDLTVRLPFFKLLEWQRIASAINQFASDQQLLLAERKKLALRLMSIQEEERRYLARELHDELGQCLAASNAVATSIAQTAQLECPVIEPEITQIIRINQQIMHSVHTMLRHLRPSEIDALGLEASLHYLVSEWNSRKGNTRYVLTVKGDCQAMTEPLALAVFRIIQECLTNIAKHAMASLACVILEIDKESVTLTIEDNGFAKNLPFPANAGVGLLGIRERVNGLVGEMKLSIAQPTGLIIRIMLPLIANTRQPNDY